MGKKRGKRNFYAILQIAAIIILLLSAMYIINKSLTLFAIFESQPDSATGKDAYIRENSDNNYGTATTIRVGKAANGINFRGIIEFNISSIPAGNTITSGIMQFYVSSASNTENITIKVYRVTKAWDEGTGVGDATGDGTTWTNATGSVTWTTAGGDYAEEVASVTFANTSNQWYNFTITSIVSGWYNGSYNNNGLIIISTDAGNGNYTDISSSDAADPSLRPKLTVDYTSNAAPKILSISTDTSPTSLKHVGQNVTFTIGWSDSEGNNVKALICNSSNISNSQGCGEKTFCNTSFSSSSPITCQYTITDSENRTQNFFVSVCDTNCSESNQSQFYMNHFPTVLVVQPNGGEVINQSQGNYNIKFNVSDSDSDTLTASIYYGNSQNSTNYTIASNLALSSYCYDPDSKTSTTNNCSYSWNSSGVYGGFFLTVILNDSFITSTDSSNSNFSVVSLIDNTPPYINASWIEEDIYSGKIIQIYANVTEPNINSVWVSINTTAQTNLTMTNISLITYNASWKAVQVGNYQYKIYARDIVGNLNDTEPWKNFSIRKPNATAQNQSYPPTVLPFSVIKISGQLNATNSLRDVYAYLNIPDGFTFLSDYPQNSHVGNFSSNETKTATWFLSTPLAESSYTLNITYTDYYSNVWNSSNFNIQITSAIGGYSLLVSGYPEVETGQNYYTEASFKISGIATAPDNIKITLYNPAGAKIVDSVSMTEKETGVYNYSYPVPGSGATEGQWETRVNATKGSTSYYSNQFWKLVGGVFDVRSIVINDNTVPSLSISVTLENTGGADKDMFLSWNLTKESDQAYLISGLDTVRVSAYSSKTHTITPSTNYIGQVRITFVGEYSAGEKAGAYKIFSTTSEGAVVTPSGGGGGVAAIAEEKKAALVIQNFEKEIKLARSIEKTLSLEVNNTGGKTLTNITLEIEGLNKSYYKITPASVGSLTQNKTQKFTIRFFITDFIGETGFNYLVKTKETTAKESGKIIVTDTKEFLLSESERLKERIAKTKEKITQTEKEERLADLLSELSTCESIVKMMEFYIKEEKFIEANANIKEADNCIGKVDSKIGEIKKEAPLKLEGYWFWIITWLLILLLIAAIGYAIYLIYRKLSIAEFLKKESKTRPLEESRKIKENFFEEKIKSIEKKLK